MTDVVISGGGLAGLTSSILLARAGMRVTLIEKKQYPFQRVCGEYISNEVIPFLEANDLFPSHLNPAQIKRLVLSTTSGKIYETALDLGGFGVSRYQYDAWLAQKAQDSGVTLMVGQSVDTVTFESNIFKIQTSSDEQLQSRFFIGAHGKRSLLDKQLNRDFLKKKSPYVGVKYHLRTDLPSDVIFLHNFNGGYCGVNQVEDGVFNLCYLVHRDMVRQQGSVASCENQILSQNPHLKILFEDADFLFEKPEVINEVSFEVKEPRLGVIPLCGDAAGTITPLCGNGMANAIRAAVILSRLMIEQNQKKQHDPEALALAYEKIWLQTFSHRLWAGRQIQRLFGSGKGSAIGVFTGNYLSPIARFLIRQTHGQPFN
jgi:flavin-dependent dehydrogenase